MFYNRTGFDAILAFQPEIALGCTATPVDSGKGMDVAAYTIFGHNFVSSAFDVEINISKILTHIKGTREKAKHMKRGTDFTVLMQSLMYNDRRNQLILKLIKIRLSEGHKLLVITKEVKHTLILWEMLKAEGIDCDYLAGKKKNYNDCDVLIGIYQRCGIGFDEKAKCKNWGGVRINKVILTFGLRNPSLATQILGRSMRAKNPSMDHLVDDDPTIESQYQTIYDQVYATFEAVVEILEF